MMSNPRIAIIGASARAAVDSAVRAGMLPVAADLFADVDLRRTCSTTVIRRYPQGFANWLAATDVDGWIYTGALENYSELVQLMSTLRPVWGNSAGVLRHVRSSQRLGKVLHDAGLLFPETRSSPAGIPREGTWLVKSIHSSSGSGVRVWDRSVHSRSTHGNRVFQRRVDGISVSAIFVAAGGNAELVGVTEQLVGTPWTGAGQFQYTGSIGPWIADENQLATIRDLGRTLAERFTLVGLFGVDLIVNQEGVWTIEVNPRYTASVEVLEKSLGIAALGWHVSACRDGVLPCADVCWVENCVGKAILFARDTVRISERFAAWADVGSRQAPFPSVADVPALGTVIHRRRPVVTVFARGDDVAEVRAGLQARIAMAEAEIYGT